jgi:hypothetical protein
MLARGCADAESPSIQIHLATQLVNELVEAADEMVLVTGPHPSSCLHAL